VTRRSTAGEIVETRVLTPAERQVELLAVPARVELLAKPARAKKEGRAEVPEGEEEDEESDEDRYSREAELRRIAVGWTP